jgi:hypothetical protein
MCALITWSAAGIAMKPFAVIAVGFVVGNYHTKNQKILNGFGKYGANFVFRIFLFKTF